MADIQTASNTTRGNLYYYFPGGKEELAKYVIKNAEQATSIKLKRFFPPEGEPVQDITNYFLSMVDEVEHQDCNVSLHLLLLETAEISDQLKAVCVETIRRLDQHFYNEIAKCGLGQAKTCQLASVIVSMLLGAVNNCMVQSDSAFLRGVIPQLPLIFAANGYLAGRKRKPAN